MRGPKRRAVLAGGRLVAGAAIVTALAGGTGAAVLALPHPVVHRASVSLVTPQPDGEGGVVPHSRSRSAAPPLEARAANGAAGAGPSEPLVAAVRPGSLVPPPATLDVHVVGDEGPWLRGQADLRLVDGRGSLAGWRILAAVETCRVPDPSAPPLAPRLVRLRPQAPTVLDGDHGGLLVGHPRTVRAGEDVLVLSATAGHGGGTFVAHVAVAVAFPPGAGVMGDCVVRSAVDPTGP